MPLDSTNCSQTETETTPDLSKPSLEGLSWLLRHLPATHKWDFNIVGGGNGCGSAGCAIGLFDAVWPECSNMCETLGIDLDVAHKFFGRSSYRISAKRVTPIMVADRIDAYLAETRK